MNIHYRLLCALIVFVAFLAGAVRNELPLGLTLTIAVAPALLTGVMLTDDDHVRGKRRLSYLEARTRLEQLCRRLGEPGFRGFGGVSLPSDARFLNFLFQGGMGGGKTILLYLLMYEALRDRTARALLHDYKMVFSDFLAHISVDPARIKRLALFDRRSWGLDLQSLCPNNIAARVLAKILAPADEKDAKNFFDGSVQSLLAAIMIFFLLKAQERGGGYVWTLGDVVNAAKSMADMLAMFSQYPQLTPILSHVAKPNQDVEHTLANHLSNLEPIAALWRLRPAYNLRQWTQSNDILLIGYDARYPDQSGIVNSLFLYLAKQEVLAQPINRRLTPTYFFLEEFPTIFPVPGWESFMNTAREFKCCLAAVIQSATQLQQLYKDKADDILQAFGNVALLPGVSKAAEFASKRCGQEEVRQPGGSVQVGDGRISSTDNWSIHPRAVVMPEEIEQLPLLRHDKHVHAYFVLADLLHQPYYHKFSQRDLQSIWKNGGYITDYDRVPDNDPALELPPWTAEDRQRLGVTDKPQYTVRFEGEARPLPRSRFNPRTGA